MTIIIHDKISEEPEIDCGHSAIMIKVKTSRQKPSYIFAKGYFRKEGCIFNNTDTANFTLEQCNINKKRQVYHWLKNFYFTKSRNSLGIRCSKEIFLSIAIFNLVDFTNYYVGTISAITRESFRE